MDSSWTGQTTFSGGSLHCTDDYAPGDNRIPKSIGIFRRGKPKKKRKQKDEDDEFVPNGVPVFQDYTDFDHSGRIINPAKSGDVRDYKGAQTLILDYGAVDVNYDQAYALYERLSDKERAFLAPRGNYVDSPNLLLRKGYVDDYCCYAFCDVYKFKDDIDTGILTVAVDPCARGEGLGYHAAKSAMEAAAKFGISNFVYRVDKKNKPSIGLAEKLGGQLESEDEKMYRFKILL